MLHPRVVVFIDGSNIYFAQKKMGQWLDWVKVKRFLEDKYQVLEFRYYVGIRDNDDKMGKFLSKLKKIGFNIFTKPVKILLDQYGHPLEKANFDVEITGDVLQKLPQFERVVLFSGDSDFSYLIHLVHEQGRKVDVFSSRKTLSYELKLCADNYFLLEKFSHLTKGNSFDRL